MSCTYCGSEENLIVGPMTDICEKCAQAEVAHNAQLDDPSLEMVVEALDPQVGDMINVRFVKKEE